jgi:hypothetical protein
MAQRCGSAFRCRGFWLFQHALIPESRSLYAVASEFLGLLISELVALKNQLFSSTRLWLRFPGPLHFLTNPSGIRAHALS